MCKDILNVQNNNPFVWNLLPILSFKYLVENYDNINFKKIIVFDDINKFKQYVLNINDSLSPDIESIEISRNKIKNEMYYMLIDNNIIMYTIHFEYNKMKTKEYCVGCKNGIETLKATYLHRLERMLTCREDPVFFFNVNYKKYEELTFNSKYTIIYYTTLDDVNKDTKYFFKLKPCPSDVGWNVKNLNEPKQLVEIMKNYPEFNIK
jgi:hypothetical protein